MDKKTQEEYQSVKAQMEREKLEEIEEIKEKLAKKTTEKKGVREIKK